MIHSGVKAVKDLLDSSNYNFLSYTAFFTKYNIKTNYLEYYKDVSSLNTLGKNVAPIKTLLPWKRPLKTCSLPREFAKRFIRLKLATLETAKSKQKNSSSHEEVCYGLILVKRLHFR